MLEVKNLCRSFGAIEVTKNVTLSLEKGERRVILGPNGAGKTTLFNLLTGTLQANSGKILLEGQDISKLTASARARAGIARSYQKNNLFEDLTIRENLMLSVAVAKGKSTRVFKDSFKDRDVRAAAENVAEQIMLADMLDIDVRNASYGNRRQLEVGIALAASPKLLLMDEPTSGVGPSMIEGFHQLLHALPKDLTILIVEHDMDLAFDVADKITVLNYGEVIFEGTPDETKGNSVVREIYLGEGQGYA